MRRFRFGGGVDVRVLDSGSVAQPGGSRHSAQAFGSALILIVSLGLQAAAQETPATTPQEEIVINLGGSGANDALIAVVAPPVGSPDTLNAEGGGIRIQQVEQTEKVATGVAGFKMNCNTHGDFRFELDVDINKLEQPKKGWANGVMIRVITDDPEQGVIAFGRVAHIQLTSAWWMTIEHNDPDKKFQRMLPSDFQKGTLRVERIGDRVSFTAIPAEDSKPAKAKPAADSPRPVSGVIVADQPCTTASLQGIHVWATRPQVGSGAADVLLKTVRLKADGFFSYREPELNFWNRWTIFWAVVASNVVAFSAAAWKMKRKA